MNFLDEQPTSSPAPTLRQRRGARPFRRAVLGGLGVVLPPLLTIVILVWIWNTVRYYVLEPVTAGAGNVLTWSLADVRTQLPADAEPLAEDPTVYLSDQGTWKRLESDHFVPLHVYDAVLHRDGARATPQIGVALYRRYVDLVYLRPFIVVPVFLCVFVVLMYLLGSLFAAGLGQIWSVFESAIGRLPFVRGVYGSVKQVTEFMLTENELEFTRVVAIEYPSRGIWALAFVTGEALPEVSTAMGEPVLSLLVPTSPMPVTGYTLMAPKSEVVDLDVTVDQAVQYIVSCGVVVPLQQVRARALSIG